MAFSLLVRYDRCHLLVSYCYSVVACHSHTFPWILFFSFSWHQACKYFMYDNMRLILLCQREIESGALELHLWNLQMDLECRKTVLDTFVCHTACQIKSLWRAERRRNEEKNPRELLRNERGKRTGQRSEEQKQKQQTEMANTVN